MRLSRMMSCVVAVLLTTTACSDDEPETESSTSTEVAAATTTEPDDASVPAACDPYIAFVGAQDGAQRNTALGELRSQLDEDEVQQALDVLEQANSDLGDLADANATLRSAVQARCAEEWAADVVAYTGDDLATVFYDAVVAGDRVAAERVAPADVLAEFEPWEPIPPNDTVGSPALTKNPDDTFNMLLGPTVTVYCEMTDGVVTSCGFGE